MHPDRPVHEIPGSAMAYLGYSEDFDLDDDGILRDSTECMCTCFVVLHRPAFLHIGIIVLGHINIYNISV